MQAKKRYIVVFVSVAFLAYCYYGRFKLKSEKTESKETPDEDFPPFLDPLNDQLIHEDLGPPPSLQRLLIQDKWKKDPNGSFAYCRMDTCFDYTKCEKDFKVYVYPQNNGESDDPVPSVLYQKILNVILESRYYTSDPTKACLFVLSIDTLDRDPLSVDFVRNLPAQIEKLQLWNNGKNHVVFNLYSGTWPDYSEDSLGFNPGMAILAKASSSVLRFRYEFDVALPLFTKEHPEKGGEPGSVVDNKFPVSKKYLLAFKGKRYVHGIGSETRNSLYHLHNKKDMIVLTTCRHGKSWKMLKDGRCDEDNAEFDRYDYNTLLENSTYCLVPRGRRLGSFRFLECLKAGCIPVILSNGWVLPFSEVIHWDKAVIKADERLLLQVPDMIRSINATKTHSLRQQTQILWDRYFSSVEKIVFTALEIIRERLPTYPARGGLVWNNSPGALVMLPNFSDIWKDYPFYLNMMNEKPGDRFTAVVYSTQGKNPTESTPLFRLIKTVAQSRYIARIVVVWSSEKTPPPPSKWPSLPSPVSLNIMQQPSTNSGDIEESLLLQDRSISQRFYPHGVIKTDAVLSLDEDCSITAEEIDFAFKVWQSFPDRIVGYPARSHYWDEAKSTWGYTSKWTNDYSIILTGACFYHRYYNFLYTSWLSPLLHKTVEQSQNCEDILMNFLVSHVTHRPPIKVTQRKQYKEQSVDGARTPWNDPDHFVQRQTCLNTFAAVFGYMPLMRSVVRMDPVLYKDSVSIHRKKYKQIEITGS